MPVRKILICGQAGAGKTTLAKALAPRIGAAHFEADEVRKHINKDLGFSVDDRIEQARRMGWLCDQVVKGGGVAIADFICPTPATREAFVEGGPAVTVWVDRIQLGRFADTNKLFKGPLAWDVRVEPEGTPEYWAEQIAELVRPSFDPKLPTAFFLGRYQPLHQAHKALIAEGIQRVGQACIAVRDTGGTDAKNPFDFEYVRGRIETGLREFEGRFVIIQVPNITNIFYGRNVGYAIERIDLDATLQAVSATDARARMFGVSLTGDQDRPSMIVRGMPGVI
jgi:adenylylsulfate kinase